MGQDCLNRRMEEGYAVFTDVLQDLRRSGPWK
jgi:hypothetical protein